MSRYIVTINEESSAGKAFLSFIKNLSFIEVEKEETYLRRTQKTLAKNKNQVVDDQKLKEEELSKKFIQDFWAEDSENK